MIEQIQKAAVAATSTEDLELLSAFHKRGALYSDCTVEERAAWERHGALAEAAALRVTGQPLSQLCG